LFGFWNFPENLKREIVSFSKNLYTIRLLNKCLLSNSYFSIQVEGKKRKFRFINGNRLIYLEKNSRVRLAISEKYSDNFYLEKFRTPERNMVLIAKCKMDNSLEKTMKSIRDAFK